MSKISDAEDILVAKLTSILAGKYNIYRKIEIDGYTSPFIVLDRHYGLFDADSTNNSKRLEFHFSTLIGLKYTGDCYSSDGAEKQEELENDIEKIFELAHLVKETEIAIDDDVNQGDNTKVSLFTLIL